MEKNSDEQKLIAARRREQNKFIMKPPTGRHSRFGGTYIVQNMKSITDNDLICHQQLHRAISMDFDHDKNKRKQPHRTVREEDAIDRRSALSVR